MTGLTMLLEIVALRSLPFGCTQKQRLSNSVQFANDIRKYQQAGQSLSGDSSSVPLVNQ